MQDLTKRGLENTRKRLDEIIESLDLGEKHKRLSELENISSSKNFWENNKSAGEILKEIERIRREIDRSKELDDRLKSIEDIFVESTDEEILLIKDSFEELLSEISEFETLKFLSGKYDNHPAIFSIYAGQGGTESNDWANMLLRMYQMYFDKKEWKYEILEIEKGSETGISSVSLIVNGDYTYGLLKNEHGTHRLVRISPFNAQGLRQTTFAGVEVIPYIEDSVDKIEIRDSDIEFKAVRSGGPGGQNVNKTSSAVQIKHIPTGITVSSSSQRDQAQNRESAMNILRGKLLRIMEEKRLNEIEEIKGDYRQASWGNQIRNYVLHPYKLVKDLRTNVEINDAESVLDGNLDLLIESALRIQ